MQLRAPAKINLWFKILSRRDDGFHEIETLMAPVSLYDDLTLSAADDVGDVQFSCDDPSLPSGDDNLVVRAARLFFRSTGIVGGVRLELRKHIPHGAGLGGGSSDAATVLLGLDRMFGSGLEPAALATMGAEIGSDVPFFIYGSACVCRGRGELVEPAVLQSTLPLLLLKPAFGVPTPWAYSRWRESKELRGVTYAAQSFGGTNFVNDLERPVFEKYVFLARLKMWLLAQPEVGAALLSGSGSTVLAVLRENASAGELAQRAKAELDPELWSCACQTVSGDSAR